MASLAGLMSATARVELARLPPHVRECSMLYMPHLGYLLAVRLWADNLSAEDKELPDMKFMVSWLQLGICKWYKLMQACNIKRIYFLQFQNNDYIHYKSKGCEGKLIKLPS